MNQLWIEPVGNIIIARVRGVPTEVPAALRWFT